MDEFELYHKRCRLCTSEHRLAVNIFGQQGVALNLQFKIQTYLSLNATSEDELPKQVCYQCLYHIESFHNFKESCIESDHTLRNWHLFYGGFPRKNDTFEEEELPNSPAEGDNNNSSSKISLESVAQPTSSSLSKMAQTAINTQRKQKMATYNEAMDTSPSSKSSSKSTHSSSEGKVDIITKKKTKNALTISGDKPDRQENSEVSRILLNMSGVGTISVTKIEGSGEDSATQTVSNKEGNKTIRNQQSVIDSIIISDDEDETDGFSGFDFEETTAIETSEEILKNEGEEVLVAEFIPSDCLQIDHLEVDRNGEVTMADDNPLVNEEGKSNEFDDSLRYSTLVTPDETRFACLKCKKTFSQKSYVKEHMKIHTGEKPFKCSVCGRSFRNNYMLKVHFRLHTGEKNFKCEVCGALFTERGALVSHLRTHTGVKPFSCTFCDRKFAQNPALKRHLRIHTKEKPYTCEHCGASFADRGTWRNHMRTHTGERPYACTLCGKSFVQRTNLQAHIKTHTDERPFQCQVCDSSFRTKAHLVKHLSTIHRDVMKSVVTFMNDPKGNLPEILKT